MFQSFIYLNKRLSNFNLSKRLFHESKFLFAATGILDVSPFVELLWFLSLYYEILIVVLSLFFSLLLLQAFQHFTGKVLLAIFRTEDA